ncbi:FtsK/SpoIIIE domain-containing protein [Lysinibacter cavernae]|uniref:FtsK/SpoIIIE domain-containing protein n=1 Tax=Lysinibacter cavernae TaxID=1640652 RepID=UPI00361672AA
MAAPRQQNQSEPSSVLIAVISIIVAIGATYLRLPGFAFLWLGLLIAAFSTHPPLLTGPKDLSQYPTVGNDAEEKKLLRHRKWVSYRRGLMLGNAHKSLQEFAKNIQVLSEHRSWWKAVIKAVQQSVLRLKTATLIALGLALVAVTLPTDLIGIDYMWLNAISAYVIASQWAAATRTHASVSDPKPPTTLQHFAKIAVLEPTKIGKLVGAALGSFTVGFLVFLVLGVIKLDWLVYPSIVTAAGAGVMTFATFLHSLSAPETHKRWRDTVEARSLWSVRWEVGAKLKDKPILLSHTRLGEFEECRVDLFEAPVSSGGAEKLIAKRNEIAAAMGSNITYAFKAVPTVGSDGQPILGTHDPLRFKVIQWDDEHTPDITDPSLSIDIVSAWLDTQAANISAEQGHYVPDLVGEPTPIFKIPSDDADAVYTAAYATEWTSPSYDPTSLVASIARFMGDRIGAEAIAQEGTPVLYVGAVSAMSTPLLDEGFREQLEDWGEIGAWAKRWENALPMGVQAPFIQYQVRKEDSLANGTVVHSMPFMVPQGISPEHYFEKVSTGKLATTLNSAPFITMTGYAGKGARAGDRHPGAFTVLWADSPVSSNPASLRPRTGPRANQAATWVLTEAINRGFKDGRLPRPEVVSTRPLTKPQGSRQHIWDIALRLYDGVTLAKVKKVQEEIRQAFGCEWIRITEYDDGCRIVAGADPNNGDVVFERKRDETLCVRLDWEQAFTEAKVMNERGQTPTLIKDETLPKNPDVRKLTFALPSMVTKERANEERKRLSGKTGNGFIQVHAGSTPAEMIVLASIDDPMPFPAPFPWADIEPNQGIWLGTGVDGEPVIYDHKIDPHIIVYGGTGTGKSGVLQVLATGAVIQGADLYIIDPIKGAADFKYLAPWVKAIATTDLSASAMMDEIYKEVERRRDLNALHGVADYTKLPLDLRPPHINVIIDEFTSLISLEARPKPQPTDTEDRLLEVQEMTLRWEARRNIGGQTGKMFREARSAGITFFLGAQELKSEVIKTIPGGGSLKGNSSTIMLGRPGSGDMLSALKKPTEAPDVGERSFHGRGIFETGSGRPVLVQAFYDADSHEKSMAQHIGTFRRPLRDDERVDLDQLVAAKGSPGPVFGQLVERDIETKVIDLGVQDLGFDFEFTDDIKVEESTEGSHEIALAVLEHPAPEGLIEISKQLTQVTFVEPIGTLLNSITATEESADWLRHLLAINGTRSQVLWLSEYDVSQTKTSVSASQLQLHENQGVPLPQKIQTIRQWLIEHPTVSSVDWIDPLAGELDEIGIPFGELARDVVRGLGVDLRWASRPRVVDEADLIATVLSGGEVAPFDSPSVTAPPALPEADVEFPAETQQKSTQQHDNGAPVSSASELPQLTFKSKKRSDSTIDFNSLFS